MKYVAYRVDQFGNERYFIDENTTTTDINEAKVYRGRFWIELLKILWQVLLAFGIEAKIKKL